MTLRASNTAQTSKPIINKAAIVTPTPIPAFAPEERPPSELLEDVTLNGEAEGKDEVEDVIWDVEELEGEDVTVGKISYVRCIYLSRGGTYFATKRKL